MAFAALPILASLVLHSPSFAGECDAATATGETCACKLDTLRPLQGAIGVVEVKKKAASIAADPQGALDDLKSDPIKIVRGPGGAFYILDHHHGARAWIEAGRTDGVCQLQCDLGALDADAFWRTLKSDGLVRLEDENGAPIEPRDLPSSVTALPNDAYRSLAHFVQRKHWICRALMSQTEFAEFRWADWFRGRPELSGVKTSESPQDFVEAARKLVERASDAPPGAPPPGEACPAERPRLPKCARLP